MNCLFIHVLNESAVDAFLFSRVPAGGIGHYRPQTLQLFRAKTVNDSGINGFGSYRGTFLKCSKIDHIFMSVTQNQSYLGLLNVI